MNRVLNAAVVALATVSSACAGSATGGSTLHPVSLEATTSTTAAATGVAADRAAAISAALTLSDLPPGWTSKERTGDGRAAAVEANAAACLGVSPELLSSHTAASSDSPDFTSRDGAETISS